MIVENVAAAYIRDCRLGALREMRFFATQRRLGEAIRDAALCRLPSGKRHPHQRRLPKTVLENAERRLLRVGDELAQAADFATLHRLVERTTVLSGGSEP